MPNPDKSYRLIFSHPRAVQDLITGFVHGNFVKDLDFSTLEPLNTAHISNLKWLRHNDILWKLNFKGEPIYLFLMLEFQSRPDHYMALRMNTYVNLLYQGLLRAEVVRKGAPLPHILPIVLYNGDTPWTCATDIADLVSTTEPELHSFVPKMRYLLINESDYADAPILKKNIVSAIFALENSKSRSHTHTAIAAMKRMMPQGPEGESLEEALIRWIRDDLSKKVAIPSDSGKTLEEIDSMLAKRIEEMCNEAAAEAASRAAVQGMAQGMASGRGVLLSLVLSLIEKKFGHVSNEDRDQISAMSIEQLREVGERILAADAIGDLLS